MQYVRENTALTLNIPFADRQGAKLDVKSVRYTIYNGKKQPLFTSPETVVDEEATFFAVNVTPEQNALGGELLDARSVSVELITETKTEFVTEFFLVESANALSIMLNSFMTMPQAIMVATGFVSLPGWSGADERRRQSALIQAFSHIISMTFEYTPLDIDGEYKDGYEEIIGPHEWSRMTENKFLDLPLIFSSALMKAQLLEANSLLEGNAMTAKINAGIRSETIGESSTTFNTALIQKSVSHEAMSVLSRFVYRSTRLART